MITYEVKHTHGKEIIFSGKMKTGGGFIVSADNKTHLLSKGKLALQGICASSALFFAVEDYAKFKAAEKDLNNGVNLIHKEICNH